MVDAVEHTAEVLPSYLSQSIAPLLLDNIAVAEWSGGVWHYKLHIQRETLQDYLSMQLAWWMKVENLSVRSSYSDILDHELDQKVRSIKARKPHVG